MADMEQIFIRAYADGIVASLKARFSTGDQDAFAAVSLGEESYDNTVYAVSVKFFWEATNKVIGTVDRSLQTVLRLDLINSVLTVGYDTDWHPLHFATVDSSADWIVQLEQKVPDFSW